MSKVVTLIDTGPLVGLLSSKDQHHERAKLVFAKAEPPLYTTWPVMTEAAWMLRNYPLGLLALFDLIIDQKVRIEAIDELAVKRVREILEQYQSLRLQLADASLVYLAEQLNTTSLITFDLRDMTIVQLEDGRHFDILDA